MLSVTWVKLSQGKHSVCDIDSVITFPQRCHQDSVAKHGQRSQRAVPGPHSSEGHGRTTRWPRWNNSCQYYPYWCQWQPTSIPKKYVSYMFTMVASVSKRNYLPRHVFLFNDISWFWFLLPSFLLFLPISPPIWIHSISASH